MDRSAVIRSMDREHLSKVSDPYPLEGLIKADHKRFTVTLHQCNLLSLLGTLQLQVQEQTHAHTHTHLTARLDLATRWLHHCFMSNMGWWWQTHVWGMDRVCIGYGTGYETKSMTFPDCQKVWLSTAAPSNRGTRTGSHSENIVMNHGKSRMIGGMDRGVWIACGPGPLIHTFYFDVRLIYIYIFLYIYI